MYHDQEEFKTFKTITSHLSRLEYKDLVKDYTISPENQEAHQRVQSYKEIGLDIASVLVEGEREGEVDWALYRELKNDQQRLGKKFADFAAHRLYAQQSGLTEESFTINVGLKARPLSRTEEVACKRVELYCETAQEARTVWNSIKITSHGQRYIDHEQYQTFQTLRDQRDELAKEIINNEPLHQGIFFKVISTRFHYGKSVLYKQAAAYEERQREKHDERQNSLFLNR